jgi:hypothetical protein
LTDQEDALAWVRRLGEQEAAAGASARHTLELLTLAIATALEAGSTWDSIAAALGVSRQAAHKRHALRVRRLRSPAPGRLPHPDDEAPTLPGLGSHGTTEGTPSAWQNPPDTFPPDDPTPPGGAP